MQGQIFSGAIADAKSPELAPITTFNVLQSVALFTAIFALFPALVSRSIYRMKTWFCLLISCAVYSVSFLLLIGHQTGPKPPLPLCLIQAGLIYAAPPLLAASGMLFVVELHLRLSAATSSRKLNEGFINKMIWIIPGVHALVFWVAFIRGLSDLETVVRDPLGMFCHVNQSVPTVFTGAMVILLLGLMLILEAYTIGHLLRRRSQVKTLAIHASDFPLKLFIRTALYTLIGGLGIILVDFLVNTQSSVTSLNLLAVVPLSVSLVFGTQVDILQVYMFWKKRKAYDGSTSTSRA